MIDLVNLELYYYTDRYNRLHNLEAIVVWIKDSYGNWFESEQPGLSVTGLEEKDSHWIRDGNGNWYLSSQPEKTHLNKLAC